MSDKRRTYIVAQTFAQATLYARQCRLDNRDWRFVNSVEGILGIENPHVVYLPGWERLPDARAIEERVRVMTR